MKQLLSILLFSFIFTFNVFAGDYPQYYHLIRESRSLFKAKKYDNALSLYKKAIVLVDYVHIQTLLYGVKLGIQIGDCNFAFENYKKAISQGYTNVDFSQFKDCNFKNKADELSSISNNFYKNFNHDLKRIVDSVAIIDQKIRTHKVLDAYKIDSSNIVVIKELIAEFGYLDERLVGEQTAKNFFIILLHYDSDFDNKYLAPIIEEGLLTGKILPEDYAWIVDRRLAWGPKRLDPYYYQLPSKKMQSLTSNEIKIIDERRRKIGLKTISEMNIKFNKDGSIEMTEEY